MTSVKKAGVKESDILLICSNGLHRKNTKQEINGILGDEIFNRFWWTGQIKNHDSEDYDNLVDLGMDDQNNPVIMNKAAFEADLSVCIGHAMGNPYGGLFRRIQAYRNRNYSLAIHRFSSCSGCDASGGFYAGEQHQSDATKI